MDTPKETSYGHLSAELIGVPEQQLRDAGLLGGLLIAAASAAGFSPMGIPMVRATPAGAVSAVLMLEGAHIAIHALPNQQTLLFDAVAPASHDFRKGLDVFTRRLSARDIKTNTRGRG